MPVVDLVTFQTMGLLLLHIQARYVCNVCMVRYVAIVSKYVVCTRYVQWCTAHAKISQQYQIMKSWEGWAHRLPKRASPQWDNIIYEGTFQTALSRYVSPILELHVCIAKWVIDGLIVYENKNCSIRKNVKSLYKTPLHLSESDGCLIPPGTELQSEEASAARGLWWRCTFGTS